MNTIIISKVLILFAILEREFIERVDVLDTPSILYFLRDLLINISNNSLLQNVIQNLYLRKNDFIS